MTHTSLARPTIVLLAAAVFAGCASGAATSTGTAPAPAPAGSTTSSAAASPAASPSNGLPSGVTAQMVATGDSIFHARSCARCHGADAKGARNGPDLTTATHLHVDGTYDGFVRIITAGVPADAIKDKSHTIAMRARGGQQPLLSDDEVKSVAAYVYSLSHK